jgi:hypothetical protein
MPDVVVCVLGTRLLDVFRWMACEEHFHSLLVKETMLVEDIHGGVVALGKGCSHVRKELVPFVMSVVQDGLERGHIPAVDQGLDIVVTRRHLWVAFEILLNGEGGSHGNGKQEWKECESGVGKLHPL